ncbi:phospho-N-acetylmuramoyl-pentapeptide-transferase [Buchananella hordeovulneris]|uniref:Phospho-N-acetylmuramoyl-pentapeptide-transferase n=1 Tax=Buchananella hordeovulneris TaxID=52770 RepID=A0A1Q5PVC1_9ACTO|nr:phospho-N-acetylmuramoyl-pentapeptide-transferase [Buchananella hordeovulneris]MDO5080587.1 phospho-N-acetylmuramoyl-pentapeptide-transferase [Buchananella hordeovulneris]OKL51531.1 phospho-N-acetylmuramoyl-pentapeptide-transferase [Buchananella hordeovulneris]RRD44082.1 phospho-N-acetylmuramoyl-pentapeptide-transferase [Buchananella hordeovulneris]RRD53643.1 phospho-N-acetylmuramoyl-pentapeptide-transferase [Buchananella hordeovulneris]
MIPVLVSFGVALALSWGCTPFFIRFLVRHQYGQFIRQDGPTSHHTKRGTPTMGGVVFIGATVVAYLVAHLVMQRGPSASGLLVLYIVLGLGLIGFLDDYIKISRQRSLGLNPWAKLVGQAVVGVSFSVMVLLFPNGYNVPPATPAVSVVRDVAMLDLSQWGIGLGFVLFIVWANFLIAAWSNAVNLTDGLDGLATGASICVFAAYTLIAYWQESQACHVLLANPGCYNTRDPKDLAIISAALVGALLGFLWWNGSPAQIFMGDTGALALGGAVAAMSILTHTQVLAIIIGGLFVAVVVSDVVQISWFKLTGKRVFRMAPLHHHFELKGWAEITIVIRFWMIAGIAAALGVVIFYAEWVRAALGE